MIPEKNPKIIEIGNKHGLMMHDPIQRYHIANAMQEYADQQIADKEKERLYLQQRCEAAERYCEMQTGSLGEFQEAYKIWQHLKQHQPIKKEEI